MPSPTQITVQQLSRLIGLPDTPVIIDVRIDEDFDEDPRMIPGSFRCSFKQTASLVQKLQGKKVIVVCHKGLKLSQGVGAILRDHAIDTETLVGGFVGWQEVEQMLVPAEKIPNFNSEGRTVWVTRHRPKIDRIACPWLIKRFVDPNAQFLFVEPSQVLNVAEKFDATPFDVEDVFWSHRGDQCTFDTMVEEFGLNSEPLLRLATIVRGADTDRHDIAPEASGLMAVLLGLSRMYKDDLLQLAAGMEIFDAYYRWARDAADESHEWPQSVDRS